MIFFLSLSACVCVLSLLSCCVFCWFGPLYCVYFMLSFSPIVIAWMRQWSMRIECELRVRENHLNDYERKRERERKWERSPLTRNGECQSICKPWKLWARTKRDTHTLYRFGGFDFPIVNINYNEVYKHCLFIVMYYDVQWSDYRRTFISLDSIHSHNILVGYSLKWLHIQKHSWHHHKAHRKHWNRHTRTISTNLNVRLVSTERKKHTHIRAHTRMRQRDTRSGEHWKFCNLKHRHTKCSHWM